MTLVDVCCDLKPLLFAFRIRPLWDVSLAVTISPPSTFLKHERTERKRCQKGAKLKLHPTIKHQQDPDAVFSCHLFASADWRSILLRSLLPYVVSMQRQTEMSAAEPVWH